MTKIGGETDGFFIEAVECWGLAVRIIDIVPPKVEFILAVAEGFKERRFCCTLTASRPIMNAQEVWKAIEKIPTGKFFNPMRGDPSNREIIEAMGGKYQPMAKISIPDGELEYFEFNAQMDAIYGKSKNWRV